MAENRRQVDILFVEDSLEDVELAVLHLGREGFDVRSKRVDNENDLCRVLSAWCPDIILSDYSMPGFSGRAALQVCQKLAPEVPFIFLSGTIGEELAIESIHNGATDYVLKENMRRLSTSVSRAIIDTQRRRRAREMEEERTRLITILEATSDLVAIAHMDGSLYYINQGARRLLGLPHSTEHLRVSDLYFGQQWEFILGELLTEGRPRDLWQGDVSLQDLDGSQIPVSQVVICHRNAEGVVEYFSLIARDIRDRRAYEQKIQYLANYDSLTDLPNRTLLADRVSQAINYSQWTKRSIGLMVIDINRFKLVNDGYGQEFGDRLLKQFGERLRRIARTRDTVARLNADCFAVLATELASPDDVIVLVRKLQEEIAAPFSVGERSLMVMTSIGVSMYPRDGSDFAALLHSADVAMHRLKERGESGFQFHASEMTRSASDRVKLDTELRQALAGRQLELHYQPQFSLHDGSVTGFEALMRWRHPERGFVSPAQFIPLAENSDLIHQLGEWALFTACSQLKEWDSMLASRPRMAVNVSPRQFHSKGFPDMVAYVLQSLRLEPERLELELTENVIVHDHREAAAILQKLDSLGVYVALDDFGTGYSNLSYLSRLPIHCLKIDQSFVQRADTDSSDAEIVRAVISLSESLHLRVIAEGIETQSQLELLRRHNCAEGQGYLFSRPLPVRDIPDFCASAPQDAGAALPAEADPRHNLSKEPDHERKNHPAG